MILESAPSRDPLILIECFAIKQICLQQVALQLPDHLLKYSVKIVKDVEEKVGDGQLKLFVLGDTSYGRFRIFHVVISLSWPKKSLLKPATTEKTATKTNANLMLPNRPSTVAALMKLLLNMAWQQPSFTSVPVASAHLLTFQSSSFLARNLSTLKIS